MMSELTSQNLLLSLLLSILFTLLYTFVNTRILKPSFVDKSKFVLLTLAVFLLSATLWYFALALRLVSILMVWGLVYMYMSLLSHIAYARDSECVLLEQKIARELEELARELGLRNRRKLKLRVVAVEKPLLFEHAFTTYIPLKGVYIVLRKNVLRTLSASQLMQIICHELVHAKKHAGFLTVLAIVFITTVATLELLGHFEYVLPTTLLFITIAYLLRRKFEKEANTYTHATTNTGK